MCRGMTTSGAPAWSIPSLGCWFGRGAREAPALGPGGSDASRGALELHDVPLAVFTASVYTTEMPPRTGAQAGRQAGRQAATGAVGSSGASAGIG